MKVKTMVGTLIFLIVLNIGVLGTIVYLNVADRQPPIARFMNPEPGFEPPFTRQFEGADDLSPEQQRKLRELVRTYQAEIEPLQEEIQVLENEMFTLLIKSEGTLPDSVRSIMREIADFRLEIGEHALESLQDAKEFLSEDQQRVFIRQIMSAGQGRVRGPGLDRPDLPMRNNPPFDNR